MKRRDFLRNSGVLIPSLLGGLSVKAFSVEDLLMQGMFLPTTETDHVLVIIQLSGGNDGLNTVIPLEYYSNYTNARSNIAIPQQSVLSLSGT